LTFLFSLTDKSINTWQMDGIEIQEIIREQIGKENVVLGCGGIIDIQKGQSKRKPAISPCCLFS
jgi:hypothetical protein